MIFEKIVWIILIEYRSPVKHLCNIIYTSRKQIIPPTNKA